MAGGQVAARRGQRLQIAAIGKLRRIVGRMIGRLRRKGARDGQRGEGECGNGPAIETNGKHTVRLAPGFYGSSRMRTQPAESRQPTMPRLAFNRKDMRRRIDWQGTPQQPLTPPEDAFSVALSWPEAALARVGSRNRGSHRLIIGSTTAFRRNPGDLAGRIRHRAGCAVDTILRVDDEARPGRLLDPFIDAGRAIAV